MNQSKALPKISLLPLCIAALYMNRHLVIVATPLIAKQSAQGCNIGLKFPITAKNSSVMTGSDSGYTLRFKLYSQTIDRLLGLLI